MIDMDSLAARFRRNGVVVLSAVPAFTGQYPWFNGLGNYELLFTRDRLLAQLPEGIQEWSAWSGPTPMKLLRTDPATDIRLIVARRRYDRVIIAWRRFWVHRDYRPIVSTWTGPHR